VLTAHLYGESSVSHSLYHPPSNEDVAGLPRPVRLTFSAVLRVANPLRSLRCPPSRQTASVCPCLRLDVNFCAEAAFERPSASCCCICSTLSDCCPGFSSLALPPVDERGRWYRQNVPPSRFDPQHQRSAASDSGSLAKCLGSANGKTARYRTA